jgi:hypothetical protein
VLLMIYSYGGFEAALIATGETRDARKDIPFALFTAIAAATVLFIAVQYFGDSYDCERRGIDRASRGFRATVSLAVGRANRGGGNTHLRLRISQR